MAVLATLSGLDNGNPLALFLCKTVFHFPNTHTHHVYVLDYWSLLWTGSIFGTSQTYTTLFIAPTFWYYNQRSITKENFFFFNNVPAWPRINERFLFSTWKRSSKNLRSIVVNIYRNTKGFSIKVVHGCPDCHHLHRSEASKKNLLWISVRPDLCTWETLIIFTKKKKDPIESKPWSSQISCY